jgi:hypothetical protein
VEQAAQSEMSSSADDEKVTLRWIKSNRMGSPFLTETFCLSFVRNVSFMDFSQKIKKGPVVEGPPPK